ncbi:sigma 54-interacting transcriptional regulator [Flavonifractor sp. An306]|uniref:sigma 54-interacting transcriptional regulator n=1 Tax=Flavonifractor sp. An306 TaxID=1965629 RepID=UPI00261E2CB1|nr:sigma 54-interacting transcriptional regulator [Flavonifractor sp. An306]
MIQKRVLDQIGEVVRLCEDTDGIVIVNRNGIVEYHRISLDSYWCSQETEGCHILELYPELDEDSSTILQALKTGKATYNVLQDINNRRGQRVLLESTTIPIVVDGQVECVVDSSKYHAIDQRVIRGDSGGLYTLDHIITQDTAMLTLKERIRNVAPLDSSVLIYGETGTGKELVAESLHSEGKRSGKPFVSQNCAAIPSNLLESLFFGTEKGSYTGALTRKGLLEEADGGTLFLDEINSMEIGLQAKLLKVLEEKKVRRLGGSRDIPFDVRIVAAVNEDPAKLIREHRLREDLYYRLGVVRITLPPLRKRKGDIPADPPLY